jgi:hypothetical protein
MGSSRAGKQSTSAAPAQRTGQQTAKRALEILVASGDGFKVPTQRERDAMLVALAQARLVLHGRAFDVVKLTAPVDLENAADIHRALDAIVFYEVKSTDKASVQPDFRGYFFSLSTSELLAAQSLGARYRFAFVNTRTRKYTELTLQELFQRARGIYPTWSIQF